MFLIIDKYMIVVINNNSVERDCWRKYNLTLLSALHNSVFFFPTPPTLLLSSLTFPLFFHIIPNPSPFLSHFSITYPSLLFSFISVSLPNLVYFFYITESWFCRVTWFPIFFLIFQNTTKSRFHCVLFFFIFPYQNIFSFLMNGFLQ